MDRIQTSTGRGGATSRVRETLGVGVANEVARIGAISPAPSLEGVEEAKIVTNFVRQGAAQVEWELSRTITKGGIQDDHTVGIAASPTFLRKRADITECTTCGVGVDVEIPIGIPCQCVPVTAVVVEPAVVVGVGDSVGGVAVWVDLGQEKFNLSVGARATIGAWKREEVLVQDPDTTFNTSWRKIALGAACDDMHHTRDAVERDTRVVCRVGVCGIEGAIRRGAAKQAQVNGLFVFRSTSPTSIFLLSEVRLPVCPKFSILSDQAI